MWRKQEVPVASWDQDDEEILEVTVSLAAAENISMNAAAATVLLECSDEKKNKKWHWKRPWVEKMFLKQDFS